MKVYAAPLTPMRENGDIDFDALTQHTENLVKAGVDGLAVMGTMGEFPDLSRQDRREVVTAVIDCVESRIPVMVGVGAVGTREACQLAEDASAAGASALMVLPPLYWKLGMQQLIHHFQAVADASPAPCLVYDLPALSATPMHERLIREIALTVNGVSGVKLSDNDLGKIYAAVKVKKERPDFEVMIGHRDLVLAGLLAGADGVISELANIAPEAHLRLCAAIESGNLSAAARLQGAIWELGNLSKLAAPPMLALKVATSISTTPMKPVTRTFPHGHQSVITKAATLAKNVLAECNTELRRA